MSETSAETLDDLAFLIQLLAESIPDLASLVMNIRAVRLLNAEEWARSMTDAEQTAFLKALTADIVRLNIDLACYPTGYTTAILFDMDGNPIPP